MTRVSTDQIGVINLQSNHRKLGEKMKFSIQIPAKDKDCLQAPNLLRRYGVHGFVYVCGLMSL